MNLQSRVLVQAHGLGVDSMAVTVEFRRRGIRPGAILFANTGGEKEATYDYRRVLREYLARHGFPALVEVRYEPKNFKHYPPYHSLEENCLTNGTLPSLAFGFKSCSLKWKAAPQERWTETWRPALDEWAAGRRVVKAIGYDSGPKDMRRSCHTGNEKDPRYEYWYPLQEWGWDRERCIREIVAEGLPGWDPCYIGGGPLRWIESGGIPLKSSCTFCPAMKPHEVRALPKAKLRGIVILEARAKPRLEGFMTQEQLDARYQVQAAAWEKSGRKGKAPRRKTAGDPGLVRGLWRAKRMTDFIQAEGLLPAEEVAALEAAVPRELLSRQEEFARGGEIETWEEFFGSLAGERLPSFCSTEEIA